jgi:hypothetical protein
MTTKTVLRNVEATINRICTDIKEKKGGSGADKLDSLSKLVNSYSRLLERSNIKVYDPTEDGDPTYCAKLAADKTDRKGIIR